MIIISEKSDSKEALQLQHVGKTPPYLKKIALYSPPFSSFL